MKGRNIEFWFCVNYTDGTRQSEAQQHAKSKTIICNFILIAKTSQPGGVYRRVCSSLSPATMSKAATLKVQSQERLLASFVRISFSYVLCF
jgi:hypothetical protein